MNLRPKLPDVGTTVFSVMSRRASETGSVNLGQGFPDYPIDPRLTELVTQAMNEGHNQYAPMPGLPGLREQIAHKLARTRGVKVDADTEITVTLGATEALYSAIQALVGAGDEVQARAPFWVQKPGARPVLTTDSTAYASAEPIIVTWKNAPANRWDWIGVYKKGAADPNVDSYLAVSRTNGCSNW